MTEEKIEYEGGLTSEEMKTVRSKATGLGLMRVPFPKNQINKLPRPYKKDSPKQNCPECGGYHAMPAIHLDYVGHAALTDRLLDCDPHWNWCPLSYDDNGLPLLDKEGGLWIKLTVCGMTRLGYGDAQGKTGGDAMKERIGDAIRNAAMRFGGALELWHKGDLHAEQEVNGEEKFALFLKRVQKMDIHELENISIEELKEYTVEERKLIRAARIARKKELVETPVTGDSQ